MAPESCHLIRSACLPLRMSSLSTRGSFHLRALALDPCGSKASIASFLTPGAGGFLLTSSSGTLWRSTGPDQTDVEQLRRVSDFSDESLLIPPHSARVGSQPSTGGDAAPACFHDFQSYHSWVPMQGHPPLSCAMHG
ncbi:uncharacterized protein LOC120683265 isoform X2 [Panicum virgatum]|uniref:Uncharacterized protein n=1 Tax=Panicum virgatum TaxID=38727 RepID=A0A8T0PY17_PANVG|nr:uncharacterized protein LOC120683265 isoform X2 [Panicum virgatum]KAG2567418.1 hypothetical protein PVAP13_7NG355372 [Panicum virgatum]KAG2567421.1 hypothetical protein PVAP13_7NG355372 [Panicum virgatum]